MINLKRHKDPRITYLATVPLFRGVPTQELRSVAGLTTSVRVAAGTALCERGAPGDAFFIIEDGAVDVASTRSLHNGAFFGEIALATGGPRTATVSTTVPTDVLVVSGRDFDRLRHIDKRIGDRLDAAVSARLSSGAA